MYDYGNHMVNTHESDRSWHYSNKCTKCDGRGYIPWAENPPWTFRDEMDDHMAWHHKHGPRITRFASLLKLARIVKAEGHSCRECDGTGEA